MVNLLTDTSTLGKKVVLTLVTIIFWLLSLVVNFFALPALYNVISTLLLTYALNPQQKTQMMGLLQLGNWVVYVGGGGLRSSPLYHDIFTH